MSRGTGGTRLIAVPNGKNVSEFRKEFARCRRLQTSFAPELRSASSDTTRRVDGTAEIGQSAAENLKKVPVQRLQRCGCERLIGRERLRYSLPPLETLGSWRLQLICLRQIFVLHALFGALREAHFMAILLAQKVKSQKIPENHKKPKKPRLVRQPTEGPNAL